MHFYSLSIAYPCTWYIAASIFIVFSFVYNNLSSMPKEEGEQLQKTEDEAELQHEDDTEVDDESPPTG